MSRRELERRVDELAQEHSGEAFAEAVRRYSETLDAAEQEELQSVLLDRARLLEGAVDDRYQHRGWLRRVLAQIEELERRVTRPGKPDR